jgi:phospholipid/cholesterol/gamma-HCH transport system substrate-binding protein
METRANNVWVGAVTLAMLVLLAAAIIWIARLNEGGKNEYDIFFKQAVDGLSKGSAVNFSGVPVGQVKVIELWHKDPGFVRVRISVDKEVAVRLGTTATIQSNFTGISNIQLEGASKDAPLLVCDPVNKRAGLGELLNSAPVLLERLATLTERLTAMFSDKNQQSIENILANADRMSGSLADASPQLQRTLLELQKTMIEAQTALAQFQQVAGSTNAMMNDDFRPMVGQFNKSLKSINKASDQLDGLLADMRPGARRLNENTLPEAEATIRDLRSTTKSLRAMTEKLNEQGAKGLLGGDQLPDYKP